jgi:hypothetical protein
MGFWQRFLQLDRKWIFIGIAIVVIIPLIKPLGLPIKPTKPVIDLFTYIDTLGPESDPVMVVTGFDPSTMPELMPMEQALLRHCLTKGIPVISFGGLYPAYIGMAKMAIDEVSADFPDKKYGEDYVFLGFIPGVSAVILSIGIDIATTFGNDYYGTPIDSLPMLRGVKNYSDISLVVDVSGSSTPEYWLMYAQERYGVNIGVACTAVSAPAFYAFLQSGQFVGMLGGLKGAAEYEELMARKGYPTGGRPATIGMDSQSLAHLLIILLIILGNAGYFIVRRGERRQGIIRRKK